MLQQLESQTPFFSTKVRDAQTITALMFPIVGRLLLDEMIQFCNSILLIIFFIITTCIRVLNFRGFIDKGVFHLHCLIFWLFL